jgi:cell division protein FtsL
MTEELLTHRQLAQTTLASDKAHVDVNIDVPHEEEFKLFVATVYGEVGGIHHSQEVAWKAVASVIINRVGVGIWIKYKTVTAVIQHTHFDTYTDLKQIDWSNLKAETYTKKQLQHLTQLELKKFKMWHKHGEFLKAWGYLHKQTVDGQDAMIAAEIKILETMERVLRPIYFEKKVTTTANYYYSPRSMPENKMPSFLKYLNPEEHESSRIVDLEVYESDAKFYDIPASLARRAGERKNQTENEMR